MLSRSSFAPRNDHGGLGRQRTRPDSDSGPEAVPPANGNGHALPTRTVGKCAEERRKPGRRTVPCPPRESGVSCSCPEIRRAGHLNAPAPSTESGCPRTRCTQVHETGYAGATRQDPLARDDRAAWTPTVAVDLHSYLSCHESHDPRSFLPSLSGTAPSPSSHPNERRTGLVSDRRPALREHGSVRSPAP